MVDGAGVQLASATKAPLCFGAAILSRMRSPSLQARARDPQLLRRCDTPRCRVDIRKVQELLGHRHVTTTQIYDKHRRTTKESASHDVPI